MPQRKSTAFYVETLLLVLFLLGILSVLVPMFTASRIESRKARQLTTSVQLAQNVTECMAASQNAEQLEKLLCGLDASFVWQPDGSGELLLAAADKTKNESYRLKLTLTQQPTMAGTMAGLRVAVYADESEPVYTAKASHYWPGTQQGGETLG